MNTTIPMLAVALFLAGCEASRPPAKAGPYVRPGLIMVPADQAHLYGLGGDTDRLVATEPPNGYPVTDARSVQTEAPVTAIQFNRYVDPARPSELMHEAHVVYRRESPPRWRLQTPAAQQQILVGPNLTEGRGEVKPVASQELDAYLREQRSNVHQQQQVLGQVSEGMRQLAEQQQQLAKEFATLRAERSAALSSSQKEPAVPTSASTGAAEKTP